MSSDGDGVGASGDEREESADSLDDIALPDEFDGVDGSEPEFSDENEASGGDDNDDVDGDGGVDWSEKESVTRDELLDLSRRWFAQECMCDLDEVRESSVDGVPELRYALRDYTKSLTLDCLRVYDESDDIPLNAAVKFNPGPVPPSERSVSDLIDDLIDDLTEDDANENSDGTEEAESSDDGDVDEMFDWDASEFEDIEDEVTEAVSGEGTNTGLNSFVSPDSSVFLTREESYDSDYKSLIENNSAKHLWTRATNYITPKQDDDDVARTPQQAIQFAAAALLAERPWICIRESSDPPTTYDLRWYDEERGYFRDDGVTKAVQRCRAVLDGWVSKSHIKSIVEIVATQTLCSRDDLNAPDSDDVLLPVNNGVLVVDSVKYDAENDCIDTSTVELRDHDPEYRFAFALPVEWDPDGADLEFVDDWVGKLTGSDDVTTKTLWEMGGHALLPGQYVEFFGVLIGPGSDGKTQFLDTFRAVLGNDNTTGIPIDKIADSKFSSWRMTDKLANINPDIKGTKITSIGPVKNFTGGDYMEVERKNQDPYDAKSRATQIFAANEPPAIEEKTHAVKRRLMPIHIKSKFVHDPDPDNPFEHRLNRDFDDKRTRDAVLKAMLVRMLEGACRLMHQEHFTLALEHGGDERLQMYEEAADPVAEFQRACLVRDPDGAVANDDLKACYDAFARARDHSPKSLQSLVQVLKKRRDTVMRKSRPRSWSDEGRVTVQKGMSFTEEAKKHFLPGDAYWEQYGGRPDDDDGSVGGDGAGDETEGGERLQVVDVLGMDAGRCTGEWVRAECVSVLAPLPWVAHEFVVKGDVASIPVRVRDVDEGDVDEMYVVEEGDELVIEDFEVINPDDESRFIRVIPGQTTIKKLGDGEQQAIPSGDDDADDDGDGDGEGDDSQETRREFVTEMVASDSVPVDDVVERCIEEFGVDEGKVENDLQKLKAKGEVYEPESGVLRGT